MPTNNRAKEYSLVSKFKLGYRNREDQSNLPAGVLVQGSQNVLTNVSERLQIRRGYTLYGAGGTTVIGIRSSYTWNTHLGYERNLRAYMENTTSPTLEYAYVSSGGTPEWRRLMAWNTSPAIYSADINFTNFWDYNTEKISLLLMVSGSPEIVEWSGGIGLVDSASTGFITISGSATWGQQGFYTAGARYVVINGTPFTYTGGEGTTTLTGVTPDPTGIPAGAIIHQCPRKTLNSSGNLPTSFKNQLISTLNNRVYVGSLTDNSVYVSGQDNYKAFSLSSSPHVVGDGVRLELDAPPVGFAPLEDKMAISAGKDQWYETQFALSSDMTTESLTVKRLKTTAAQGAISQALMSAIKNDVVFVSNEPTFDTLGRVQQVFGALQTTNISDPIKLDFDSYDFTDGQVWYNKYYIYVTVPKHGLMRIFNLNTKNWEAPQILPVGKLFTVGGEIYGHSYITNESYKLFDGYNDNGNPIQAKAVLSYQNFGARFLKKSFDRFFLEGYISSNCTLELGVAYDMNGCLSQKLFKIKGTDKYVCMAKSQASLGKSPLGKNPLGGDIASLIVNTLPPKFRVIKTTPRSPNFYECQVSLESLTTDSEWEIIAFGPAVSYADDLPIEITD